MGFDETARFPAFSVKTLKITRARNPPAKPPKATSMRLQCVLIAN
jgi:hypothetical protein